MQNNKRDYRAPINENLEAMRKAISKEAPISKESEFKIMDSKMSPIKLKKEVDKELDDKKELSQKAPDKIKEEKELKVKHIDVKIEKNKNQTLKNINNEQKAVPSKNTGGELKEATDNRPKEFRSIEDDVLRDRVNSAVILAKEGQVEEFRETVSNFNNDEIDVLRDALMDESFNAESLDESLNYIGAVGELDTILYLGDEPPYSEPDLDDIEEDEEEYPPRFSRYNIYD